MISLVKLAFLKPEQGAYCSVFAAASPAVKAERDKYKGAFLWPPGKIGPAPPAEDEQRVQDLWDSTEVILKEWDV